MIRALTAFTLGISLGVMIGEERQLNIHAARRRETARRFDHMTRARSMPRPPSRFDTVREETP